MVENDHRNVVDFVGIGQGEESALSGHLASGTLTARAIDEAADAGDPLARRLMHETARYLAVGAVNLMHTIDPDLIIFGGGMIQAGPEFLEQIRSDVRDLAFAIPASRTRIAYAELGGDAGFIGAAGCARMHLRAGGSPAADPGGVPPGSTTL